MTWTPPTLQRSLPSLLAAMRVATTFEDAGRILLSALVAEATAVTDPDGARFLRAALCVHGAQGFRAVLVHSAEDDPTPGQVGLPSTTAWRWVREFRAPFFLNLGRGCLEPAAGGDGVALGNAGASIGDTTVSLLEQGGATHIYGLPLRRDDGPVNAVLTLEFAALARAGEPLRGWRRLSVPATLLVDCGAPLVLARPYGRAEPAAADAWLPVVGAEMASRLAILDRVGRTNCRILLLGPTGVGKSQLARRIHERSPRARGPMQTAVLPEYERSRVAGELFGWKRGAFSGAVKDHAGLIAEANGGTLFLDEIGDLEWDVQTTLLRFLDEGRYRPLAHTGPDLKADVRIIAATNRDLEQMVRDRTFREDLLFRLNRVRIELPGLDERPDEIIGWARTFLSQQFVRNGRAGDARFSPDAEHLLLRTRWPGNLRDLAGAVELALALADTGGRHLVVDEADLAEALRHSGRSRGAPALAPAMALRRAAELWLNALETGGYPPGSLAWRNARSLMRSYLLLAARDRYGLAEGLRRLDEELRVKQNNHSRALAEAEAEVASFEAGLRGELVTGDETRQGS